MVATDNSSPTPMINDSLTKRDVASWFNRQPKKMLVALTGTASTTRTSYRTPASPGVTLEGEFVALGMPGHPATNVPPFTPWTILAGATSSLSSAASTGIAACFGTASLGNDATCSGGVEPEISPLLTLTTAPALFQASGSTIKLATEGRYFMDLLMQTGAGTMTLQSGGTFVDTYLMQ